MRSRVILTGVFLTTALTTSALFAQTQTQTSTTSSDAVGAGTIVVLNKDGASASLIDRATGTEVKRLGVGLGPHEVTVSPDGKTAVVANYGEGQTLSVIDLPSQEVVKVIDLEPYHRPHGIVYLPDGQRVVVTTEAEQKLLIVNIETGKVEKAIDTGARGSHMVAIGARAEQAFVANMGSNSVSVIDLASGQRLAEISTGIETEGVDVSPDGGEVWVSNRKEHSLSIIDVGSREVVAKVECAKFPIRLKFTPDGKYVFVSNAVSGDVAIIDAKTRQEVKRLKMPVEIDDAQSDQPSNTFRAGTVPIGIVIPPDGKHAYVANSNVHRVTVIDIETLEIVGEFKAGERPDGLAYSPLVLTEDDADEPQANAAPPVSEP